MDNLEEIKILIETNYNLSVEKVSNITSKSLKVSTAQHEYVLKLAEGNDCLLYTSKLTKEHSHYG